MASKYASGKYAISECDRCGQRFKLKELRAEVIKTKLYNIRVCHACFDPDHPQLQLGMYPVNDPQAVREPRPDTSYLASGVNINGFPGGGSRQFQWGWAPVGMGYDGGLTQNSLIGRSAIGTVTVVVS